MAAPKRKKFVYARERITIVVGARPPVDKTRKVRNRRTGEVVEVELNPEAPPLDEGDLGVPYTFSVGEKVFADHPAVKQSPHAFVDYEEAEDKGLVESNA